MEHSLPLITTIAVALSLALLMGFIALRLGLPALIGYLIAGVIIGPHTPGFVANAEIAQELAEIGVILLMFGVGLHFSLANLLEVRKISLPGAVVQIIVATGLGTCVAMWWGWTFGGALVFGLALSVASTVVLLRTLEEKGLLHAVNGRIAIGWLIVEDLFMVIVLVLLPPLAGWLGGQTVTHQESHLGLILLVTLIKISAFIALMLFVGRRFFPKLLWHINRTGSRELFTLCVVAAAVGIAYGAATFFGVSFALGAFFAGMIMRESKFSHRAAEESLPLREAFAVLFFVAVGMLFDPMVVLTHPLEVLTATSIIVIGKSIAAFALVLAFGYSFGSACIVSASLAQIGEFSFILAEIGVRVGLLPIEGRSYILASAMISIALNPLVFKFIDFLQNRIKSRSKVRLLARPADPLATLPIDINKKYLKGQIILIGYGRVGKRISKFLIEKDIPFVVVDELRELITRLRDRDINAIYGDASEPLVLNHVHIAHASMLVIAVSDRFNIKPIVKCARILNKNIEVVVRTHNESEAMSLQKDGPGKAFFAEEEIAKNMGLYVLDRFAKSMGENHGS